ncbi:murein L,D-transpeptidase catalytic domain family protein [Legionella geestiana]|uniref:murein L,D-transpeptidase catalytic domain family protein n=1 Tax=Legionella geestiana TaxID=45065 RepID=UPI0010918CB2|nr:murein L,D-transpeptidase catalytic domain family protein [Legionella geestiana]QDQ39265.1 murein L,D-transpeptidase catalytic domain family protein [Legionella geestiana]
MLWTLLMLLSLQPLPADIDTLGAKITQTFSEQLDKALKDPGPFINSANDLRNALQAQAPSMRPEVLDKVLTALACANARKVEHNDLLAVVDFSMPSNEKRLWVFDLPSRTVLFNTFVSHGIASGSLMTDTFSNRYNSRATSIGVFRTLKPYYGREGLSLRLAGIDYGFNENAEGRYLVMHGGWYMDADFISKYGRPGRSWGCPAVPLDEVKPLIETIQGNTLFVAYYPDTDWFKKSRFLHCDATGVAVNTAPVAVPTPSPAPVREAILFADLNQNGRHEENEPVVVISADDYARAFNRSAPLERMLRRRIDTGEYIALTRSEFDALSVPVNPQVGLQSVHFVIPVVKESRGYYETEMHKLPLGTISRITRESGSTTDNRTVILENNRQLTLKPDSQFIRWLGL